MWHVYLITKYHCVRENTAYSKDFIQAIYGIHEARYVSYINIFKNGRGFIGYPKGRNRDIKLVN